MRFEVTISFPGKDWAEVKSVVEYHDRTGLRGERAERAAIQQLEDLVRSQRKRYAKYGGEVTWRPYVEAVDAAS